ncbi:hypothetical protein GCM10022222_75380 [Amycolatopsis ultiminotia]|uniref:Protein kinase domain-containing protein n=1 Tax=Amycolatopsis ultiminotia TaxID=543629 RepID=A0ABP6YAP6_9PSEU
MQWQARPGRPAAGPTLTGDDSADVVWDVGETVLGTYRIEEQLGAGGMGVVHRVRHLGWRLDLAVKSPLPRMWLSGIQAFVDEAEVWVGLPPHPHVCACHYVRVLGGVPRIFAEFVEGGTVAEALRDGGLRGLAEVLDVAIQLAWGLRAAHQAGVVHQDVKPGNALRTPDGLVKITDFGLARAQQRSGADEGAAGTESILVTHRGLTPAYASPEQYSGERAGRRSDVWSWAVTVLELFTGEVTWRLGAVAGEALEAYLAAAPPSGRPTMPPEVATLLRECFTTDPAARPGDLGLLAERLVAVYPTHVGRPYPRTAAGPVTVLADGYNNKALSMLDLGLAGPAKEFWAHALEADPQHLDATFNGQLGRWREAEITDLELVDELERFRFALPENDPRRTQLAYALGLVHQERRDPEAARACLDEAAPGDPEVATARATVTREAPAERAPLELTGHEGKTCPLAVSPDGRHAVSGGEDRTVRWWDLRTGECLRVLTGHTDLVTMVALSPDGRHVLSGGTDGTVRWWDLTTGRCLHTFSGQRGTPFHCVAVSAGGELALAGDAAGALWWWDPVTGQRLGRQSGHEGGINRVAVLPDGRTALSAGADGTVRSWDLGSGEARRVLTGHRGAVYALALMPGGFLSGGRDGTVRVWDLASGRCRLVLTYRHRVIDVLSSPVLSVAVAPDGHTVIAGNDAGELTWWELDTGRCLRTFVGGDTLTCSTVLSDGRTAVSCGFDKTVRWRDLVPGSPAPWWYSRPRSTVDLGVQAEEFEHRVDAARALLDRGDPLAAAEELRGARAIDGFGNNAELGELWRRTGHSGRRSAITGSRQTLRMQTPGHLAKVAAITSNGRRALSATAASVLRWWDLTTGRCLHELDSGDGWSLAAALTPDGRHAVSVGNHHVHWWDLNRGKHLAAVPIGAEGMCFSIAITPDGRRALSANTDGLLRWWDLPGERCLRTLSGHEAHINAVAVTADGRHALSGAADRTMRWWDVKSGECLRTFTGDDGGVGAVAVTPDGRHAVSGSTSGAVFAWDLTAGTGRTLPAEHTAQINSVAISADGRHALSGGEDGTLRWWDLVAGQCLHRVKTAYVASAAMTPNAHRTVTGMADGTLLLWELDWDYEFPPQPGLL